MMICDLDLGFSVFFFFQAEDGIRYLVRSRGLGDVYKRQWPRRAGVMMSVIFAIALLTPLPPYAASPSRSSSAVSYTHLTLPTSDLV